MDIVQFETVEQVKFGIPDGDVFMLKHLLAWGNTTCCNKAFNGRKNHEKQQKNHQTRQQSTADQDKLDQATVPAFRLFRLGRFPIVFQRFIGHECTPDVVVFFIV